MTGNKSFQNQLQRRTGRRISIPASPTFFEKRSQDKLGWLDAASPSDLPSATGVDSPTIDTKVPSPTFKIPGISSPTNEQQYNFPQGSPNSQLNKQSRGEDLARPLPVTSVTPPTIYANHSARNASQDLSARTQSSAHVHRDYDGPKLRDARENHPERPPITVRNASQASLTVSERSIGDEGQSAKAATSKKSRLNLLNPMSLLARRRSSQNTKLEEISISPLHVPAMPDFDPSIRGKIVHDFSAPRVRTPRRDIPPDSAQQRQAEQVPVYQTAPPPPLHSPVFREHFQDDEHTLQPGRTAYLHGQPLEAPAASSLPAFAQKLPTRLPSQEKASTGLIVSPTDNDPSPEDNSSPPPPSVPQKTSSPVLEIPSQSNLPKHMKSTSSRFSFQISGPDSAAQEKLLEERHRQRFPHGTGGNADEDDVPEDDYNDYDPDYEDDFEEPIPGINAEFEDEDDEFGTDHIPIKNIDLQSSGHEDYDGEDRFEDHDVPRADINVPKTAITVNHLAQQKGASLHPHLDIFQFAPQSMTPSPASISNASEPTPRDSEGFAIGVADTLYSPGPSQTDDPNPDRPGNFRQGVFVYDSETDQVEGLGRPEIGAGLSRAFDDADLYFDDGEFDTEHHQPDAAFDEEQLDDEDYIRSIPAENARRYEVAMRSCAPGNNVMTVSSVSNAVSRETSTSSDFVRVEHSPIERHDAQTFGASSIPASMQPSGLTENNLAVFHGALLAAANNAAKTNRFDKQVNFSEDSNVLQDAVEPASQVQSAADGSRYHLDMVYGSMGDDDAYPFDDENDIDDDLLIAEANAEALENDDDGFYGQEFGFYARSYGRDQSEFMNGGYFTSRGSNGIKRSHSGKATFQEPCLTPITERSEWSARNSVASLPIHSGIAHPGQPMASPGLNQLLDSPAFEDEMTLSALMKLRRGAFGGSSTSINSLGDRSLPNSSPLASQAGHKFPTSDNTSSRPRSSHNTGGTTSIIESEEEDDLAEWPIMAQNTSRRPPSEGVPRTPEQSNGQLKPETPVTSWKGHHSRNSSGAESVSYARDEDGRWILERRRTGDDGELEFIGREYLASGRI